MMHVLKSLRRVWRSVICELMSVRWMTLESCSVRKASAKVADPTGAPRRRNPSVNSTPMVMPSEVVVE